MQLASNDLQHGSAGASDDALPLRLQPSWGVYAMSFVGIPDAPIKFGIVSRWGFQKRVIAMQTGCPYELEILASCESDPGAERSIHRYLAHHKIRGEWFHRCGQTLKIVDIIKAGEPVLDPFLSLIRQHHTVKPKRKQRSDARVTN